MREYFTLEATLVGWLARSSFFFNSNMWALCSLLLIYNIDADASGAFGVRATAPIQTVYGNNGYRKTY